MMIQFLIKHKIHILSWLLLIMVSCQNQKTNELHRLTELLPGQWKMTDQDVIESWKFNDGILEGIVVEFSGTDTLVIEELRIIEKDGTFYYEPTVKNQNEGKPVSFRLIRYDNNIWVFENLTHDFPQQIEYNFVSSDSLVATIKGDLIGKTKTIEFIYIKQ